MNLHFKFYIQTHFQKVSGFSNTNASIHWWIVYIVQHCWRRFDSVSITNTKVRMKMAQWYKYFILFTFASIIKCVHFIFSFNSTSDAIESMTPIELGECNVDRSNTLTFKIILMMGAVFVSISALISLYINKVDRKKLLSKRMTTVHNVIPY